MVGPRASPWTAIRAGWAAQRAVTFLPPCCALVYVSARLDGNHVVLKLEATSPCVRVRHEQQLIESLPLQGVVEQPLSFGGFLTHMLHQPRAKTRLRSLQGRKYRTAAVATT